MKPRDPIIMDMLTRIGIKNDQVYMYSQTKDVISLR